MWKTGVACRDLHRRYRSTYRIRTSCQPLTSWSSIKPLFPLISLPSLPVWAYCPTRSQDLLPSSIPDLVIPLTLILPFPIRRCRSFSSFFTHVVLSSPRIPPSRYVLASLLHTNSTHFCLLSSSPFVASLGVLSGSSLSLLFAPVF